MFWVLKRTPKIHVKTDHNFTLGILLILSYVNIQESIKVLNLPTGRNSILDTTLALLSLTSLFIASTSSVPCIASDRRARRPVKNNYTLIMIIPHIPLQ